VAEKGGVVAARRGGDGMDRAQSDVNATITKERTKPIIKI
jgi:hypothetical protein